MRYIVVDAGITTGLNVVARIRHSGKKLYKIRDLNTGYDSYATYASKERAQEVCDGKNSRS